VPPLREAIHRRAAANRGVNMTWPQRQRHPSIPLLRGSPHKNGNTYSVGVTGATLRSSARAAGRSGQSYMFPAGWPTWRTLTDRPEAALRRR
jgi:hypothetical protein